MNHLVAVGVGVGVGELAQRVRLGTGTWPRSEASRAPPNEGSNRPINSEMIAITTKARSA